MTYLIIGRTGSGKDHLIDLLEKQGLRIVRSYTTRPRRTENENTHTFITADEASAITDKVATAVINGYEYFATAEQVSNADVYAINPDAIDELAKNMPDTTFHAVYVNVPDDMQRRFNAVKRADDRIKEEQIFNARNDNESPQFDEFENKLRHLHDNNMLPKNVSCVHKFDNTYNESDAEAYAKYLVAQKALHARTAKIIRECMEFGIIAVDEKDPNKPTIKSKNGSVSTVTPEFFADVILTNPHGMLSIMTQYIMKSPRFND